MSDIRVPREDANDDSAVLVKWLVEDGQQVEAGQTICEMETTKTVFAVVAPGQGRIQRLIEPGQEVEVGAPLARLLQAGESVEQEVESSDTGGPRMTRDAERFAAEHQLDVKTIKKRGIITLADLQALVAPQRPNVWTRLPAQKRVLIMGAGSVAWQAADILSHDPTRTVVGCLDDSPSTWGRDVLGAPVLGATSELERLWKERKLDEAVVAMGNNRIDLRRGWYDRCRALDIPLANVIDPSARLNSGVELGQGNLLLSFVHLGVGARLGDNNFIAAHTSIDHHCQLGSHVFMGPGCLLSGLVTVEDESLFGSGVVVQPSLRIGAGCRISSGAVIIRDVPDHHAVKCSFEQTVTPI
ncbi:MAG: hypothetical protein KC910_16945 [Candidatus Eremiobacteraeota bacterium]|nr:hypothetical protein [Candidatus Eremiobacteraeota bacterium]